MRFLVPRWRRSRLNEDRIYASGKNAEVDIEVNRKRKHVIRAALITSAARGVRSSRLRIRAGITRVYFIIRWSVYWNSIYATTRNNWYPIGIRSIVYSILLLLLLFILYLSRKVLRRSVGCRWISETHVFGIRLLFFHVNTIYRQAVYCQRKMWDSIYRKSFWNQQEKKVKKRIPFPFNQYQWIVYI